MLVYHHFCGFISLSVEVTLNYNLNEQCLSWVISKTKWEEDKRINVTVDNNGP